MKGTPEKPRCGFSHRAAQVLASTKFPFTYVNVLEDLEILENLPRYADWPTFPQIYVGGEFVGGCDIINELYESGELSILIEAALSHEDRC
jgi:monothiol glutaredoxin